jgi:hypothetical protein
LIVIGKSMARTAIHKRVEVEAERRPDRSERERAEVTVPMACSVLGR